MTLTRTTRTRNNLNPQAAAWSAAVPALAALEQAIAVVKARLDGIPRDGGHQSNVARIADSIDPARLPDDIGALVLELDRDGEARTAELEVLNRVTGLLRDQIGTTRRAGAPAALRALQGQFDELIADTRLIVATLDGARTADEAITNGSADAWQDVKARAARLRDIRAAHRALLIAGGADQYELTRLLDNVGPVENWTDIDPWRARIETGHDAVAPWPDPNDDVLAYLLWLVDASLSPWLPDLAQLQAAQTEQADLVRSGDVERRRGKAREDGQLDARALQEHQRNAGQDRSTA